MFRNFLQTFLKRFNKCLKLLGEPFEFSLQHAVFYTYLMKRLCLFHCFGGNKQEKQRSFLQNYGRKNKTKNGQNEEVYHNINSQIFLMDHKQRKNKEMTNNFIVNVRHVISFQMICSLLKSSFCNIFYDSKRKSERLLGHPVHSRLGLHTNYMTYYHRIYSHRFQSVSYNHKQNRNGQEQKFGY